MLRTFIKDRLIRDKNGIPIGRCVLLEDSAYEEGKSLSVVLVKIPISYYNSNDSIYIDGSSYRIPKKAAMVRKNTDGRNIILNNVILEIDG